MMRSVSKGHKGGQHRALFLSFADSLEGGLAYFRRFHGRFTPQNLVFDANLQEYAVRIGYISARETSGRLPAVEAFAQVQTLWEQLSQSYELLEIERQGW